MTSVLSPEDLAEIEAAQARLEEARGRLQTSIAVKKRACVRLKRRISGTEHKAVQRPQQALKGVGDP